MVEATRSGTAAM